MIILESTFNEYFYLYFRFYWIFCGNVRLAFKNSNAIAERLNDKIQEIKLSGRSYRRFENLEVLYCSFTEA